MEMEMERKREKVNSDVRFKLNEMIVSVPFFSQIEMITHIRGSAIYRDVLISVFFFSFVVFLEYFNRQVIRLISEVVSLELLCMFLGLVLFCLAL